LKVDLLFSEKINGKENKNKTLLIESTDIKNDKFYNWKINVCQLSLFHHNIMTLFLFSLSNLETQMKDVFFLKKPLSISLI
jgi:hypothetical protein